MTTITITDLTPDHIEPIIRDFLPLWPWRQPAQILRKVYQALDPTSNQHMLVAIDSDGRMVAMAAYGVSTISQSTWNLYLSATLPDYRSQGINARLIEARIARIMQEQRHGPTNIMVSTKRVHLFESMGFKPIAPNGVTTLMFKHLGE